MEYEDVRDMIKELMGHFVGSDKGVYASSAYLDLRYALDNLEFQKKIQEEEILREGE